MSANTEAALGGASLICLLRDLFTETRKDQFSREELLVLLESMTRDTDLFGDDLAVKLWAMEKERPDFWTRILRRLGLR